MKASTLIVVMLLLVLTTLGAFPAIGLSGENEQLENYYNDYISECILKNQSKAGLQTSRSENLRSCGALSEQKVIFLTHSRDKLIDEMIENEIGTKPYKIEYYLNKRFHEAQTKFRLTELED